MTSKQTNTDSRFGGHAVLAGKMIALTRELRAFLQELGPPLTDDRKPQESVHAYFSRKSLEGYSRIEKMHNSYELRFKDRLANLNHEMGEHNLSDAALDELLKTPTPGEAQIREIAERLWYLAGRLEEAATPEALLVTIEGDIGDTRKASTKKGRPLDPLRERRRKVILKIAATGATGEAYCRGLDAEGLPTPPEWQHRENCPKTYLQAYQHPDPKQRKKWRNRIADQKHKTQKNSGGHSPKLVSGE